MASGTFYLESDISTLQGKVEWSSTSNGSSANSSKVTATIYIARTDSYTTTGTWEYGFNVGGLTEFDNIYSSVSGSWIPVVTITNPSVPHNPNGTGTCFIEGYVVAPSGTSMAGHSVSGNKTVTLDNIPRYPTSNQSLNTKTVNTIKMNWSSDSTIDYVWYSKNGGTSWTAVGSVNASSGNYTITGLSPNTAYSIKTRVRRKDSQLTKDSSALSVTTYQIGQISSVSNFNHGDNAILSITNPSGASLSLDVKIGDSLIKTVTATAGTNTISFTDSELDSIYSLYGSSDSNTVTFILSTGSYTDTKTATITLTGNQKTAHTGSGNKRAKVYVGVNGSIKKAVVWVGNNGRKRCI